MQFCVACDSRHKFHIWPFFSHTGYLTFQFSGRGVEVMDKTRSVPLFQSVSLGLTKKRAMSGVKKAVWDPRLKSSSKPTRSKTMSRLPFTLIVTIGSIYRWTRLAGEIYLNSDRKVFLRCEIGLLSDGDLKSGRDHVPVWRLDCKGPDAWVVHRDTLQPHPHLSSAVARVPGILWWPWSKDQSLTSFANRQVWAQIQGWVQGRTCSSRWRLQGSSTCEHSQEWKNQTGDFFLGQAQNREGQKLFQQCPPPERGDSWCSSAIWVLGHTHTSTSTGSTVSVTRWGSSVTTTSKRVETMERLEFIMVRVQLPESKIETPSTLTPICWLPVPTYLTTTKEWWSITMVGEGDKPHAPRVLSHAGGHGHHQVHPVLPNGGVGRQVHQCLVRREKHRLTCAHGIQLKSVHVKDNFKTAPLLKMIFFKSKIKVFESLHQPKSGGQLQLWARGVDRQRHQTLHRPTLNPFHSPGFWVCVKVKIILRASVGKNLRVQLPLSKVETPSSRIPNCLSPLPRRLYVEQSQFGTWTRNKKLLRTCGFFASPVTTPSKETLACANYFDDINTKRCLYERWLDQVWYLIRQLWWRSPEPIERTRSSLVKNSLVNFFPILFPLLSTPALPLGIVRLIWAEKHESDIRGEKSCGLLGRRIELESHQVEKDLQASILLDSIVLVLWWIYLSGPFHLNFNWKGSVGCEATADPDLKLLEMSKFKLLRKLNLKLCSNKGSNFTLLRCLDLSNDAICNCSWAIVPHGDSPVAVVKERGAFHQQTHLLGAVSTVPGFEIWRVDCGQVWSSWLHPVVWFALYNILCNEYQTQC